MEPFAQDFLNVLTALHTDLEHAIADLSVEALDWVPGPDMNSIAVLIVHTLGAERWLLGDIMAGEPSNRDRDAEFRTSGLDAAALTERLTQATAYARHALESLTCGDLNAPRVHPRDGRAITVAWTLAHALDHTGLHLGHIQITRQFWDLRRNA